MATKKQCEAAARILVAIARAIKELGEVPAGHLYARLQGVLSLDQFNSAIDALERCGIVRYDRGVHVIHWTGIGFSVDKS